jgi:hypothetical protein
MILSFLVVLIIVKQQIILMILYKLFDSSYKQIFFHHLQHKQSEVLTELYPSILSPNHSFQLVTNPSDSKASPFGWHDVDGIAGADFDITKGMNGQRRFWKYKFNYRI